MLTPLLVGIYQTFSKYDFLQFIYICNTFLVHKFSNTYNVKKENHRQMNISEITLYHLRLLIYKGKLDIHLVNMAKHCSGVSSGAICPEPCKIISQKCNRYNEFAKSHQRHLNIRSN
jgi:hypothetical protein